MAFKDQSKPTKIVLKVVWNNKIKHSSAIIDEEVKTHFLNQKRKKKIIKSENIKKIWQLWKKFIGLRKTPQRRAERKYHMLYDKNRGDYLEKNANYLCSGRVKTRIS